MRDGRISRLMRVAPHNHDLAWLKESLSAAVALEFSTLPPYLTALWSIKNPAEPAAQSIREICREEMLHMGLMCNLLVAIGGAPQINDKETFPRYPGPLPGGVHPGLNVALAGLTRGSAKVFMEIEWPEHGPIAAAKARATVQSYPTIGAFYTAIQAAFSKIRPSLSATHQLEGVPVDLFAVKSEHDVQRAIDLIKRQGEGSQVSPEDSGPGDLSHYYRFAEIYNDPRPFPDCWPVAPVPVGGYVAQGVSPSVSQLLEEFDRTFSEMVNQLQAAWETGSQQALYSAISLMSRLHEPALKLMQVPIPDGAGTYAPCFRLV